MPQLCLGVQVSGTAPLAFVGYNEVDIHLKAGFLAMLVGNFSFSCFQPFT
jgi:hypothetical protein